MKELFIKIDFEDIKYPLEIKKEFKTNDEIVDYFEEQVLEDIGNELVRMCYQIPRDEYEDDRPGWRDMVDEYDIYLSSDPQTYKKFEKYATVRLNNERLTPEQYEKIYDEYDS